MSEVEELESWVRTLPTAYRERFIEFENEVWGRKIVTD